MGALNVILLVLFVITCLLIVFLVLLQNEEGDSIGGLFAGGSNSAFGSKSGNVLTKATYILVTVFFVSSFLLAILNRTSYRSVQGVQEEGQKIQTEGATPWYDSEAKDENNEVKDENNEAKDENNEVEIPQETTSSSEESSSTETMKAEETGTPSN